MRKIVGLSMKRKYGDAMSDLHSVIIKMDKAHGLFIEKYLGEKT